ncbi:MAG TPA: terminase large subunit, partial [bacterium]|nr:terminase large subunit [bacterium]
SQEKVEFIETYCTHVKGALAGNAVEYPKPLILEDWIKDEIIYPVFGLKEKKGGNRLIYSVYIEIPKKNAKTTICAAIELALLFNDGERGAEIYNCAGDAEQASLLFDIAKMMINNNAELKSISERFQTSITYKDSFIKKLTSAPETKHGFNASAVIYDELHVAKTRELFDSLYSAGAQRQNPLFIIITTAGNDKQSICYEQHKLTQKVLSGALEDDTHWGVIYSAGKKSDIYSEKTWRQANPLYDYSEPLRKFIKKMSIKVRNTPSFESTFRQLHLNQWVSAYDSWISDDDWMRCGGKEIDLTGMKCYGGLDLAATMDFNSLALLFPVEDMFYVKMFFWLPSDMVEKRVERYSNDFQIWVDKGFIKMTEGNVADYDIIKADISDLVKKYNIQSIGYDAKFSAPIVATIEDVVMNPFSQSIMSMSYPTKMLEMNIMSRKINHFNNPVLRWMCSNVAIYSDANENIKLVKNKSIDKIDGIVALVMALGESVQEGDQVSIYEKRGIVSIDDFDVI